MIYKVVMIDENFDKIHEFIAYDKPTLKAIKQCAGNKRTHNYDTVKIEIIKIFGYKQDGYGIEREVLLTAWTPKTKWVDFE
jgi:hypothetical protein